MGWHGERHGWDSIYIICRGKIEIRDKRPKVAMYCHGSIPSIKNGDFFVLNSYIDKLYIKMLGFSKEID